MNLANDPFVLIKNGKKDIEMRLYDERRKPIKIGDEILFTNNQTKEQLKVVVKNLYVFPSFKELYAYFDHKRLGYERSDEGQPSDMEIYYSYELIEKNQVLAIEIKKKRENYM